MRFVSAALNNRKLQVTERRRSAVSIIQRFLANYLPRQSFLVLLIMLTLKQTN
jgi:hypothetical protein